MAINNGSISNQVREVENENYRLRNPNKKHEFNIGIYGAGELGGHTYLELQKINNHETYSKINNTYLFGRTEEKPLLWAESSIISEQDAEDIRTRTYGAEQLPDFLQSIDILIFTASKGDKHDLKDNTRRNIELIDEITPFLDKDYQGMLVIASNQTDTLCYEAARKSKMNPLRIVGVNGLDQRRYKAALKKHFSHLESGDITAYTVGFHHNSVMLTSKTTVNNVPLEELASQEEINMIDYLRKEMPRKAVEGLGTTTQDTVPAIKNLLLAIMDEEREETVSTLYLRNKAGIYTGFPVRFHNLQPMIKDENYDDTIARVNKGYSFEDTIKLNDWLSRIPPKEQRALEKAINLHIRRFLKKFDVWQEGRIELERAVYETRPLPATPVEVIEYKPEPKIKEVVKEVIVEKPIFLNKNPKKNNEKPWNLWEAMRRKLSPIIEALKPPEPTLEQYIAKHGGGPISDVCAEFQYLSQKVGPIPAIGK